MSVTISTLIMKTFYVANKGLFDDLKEIQYAIIKGEALSLQAYGTLGNRICSDVDILIPRNELATLEKKLKLFGFVDTLKSRADKILMLSASHQTSPWKRELPPLGYVDFDINFDIFWGEYEGDRINMEEFLSDTIEIDIYGCKVKVLPPLKAMVQLILHHYKEMNSIYHLSGHNSINLNMFVDIYYLWKNNKDIISLKNLYSISSMYKIIPYVFYILYFTNWIFKDKELEIYVDSFHTLDGESLLECYGLAEKERKKWNVDFQTRLETTSIFNIIQNNLTKDDIEKLERNRRIFG